MCWMCLIWMARHTGMFCIEGLYSCLLGGSGRLLGFCLLLSLPLDLCIKKHGVVCSSIFLNCLALMWKSLSLQNAACCCGIVRSIFRNFVALWSGYHVHLKSTYNIAVFTCMPLCTGVIWWSNVDFRTLLWECFVTTLLVSPVTRSEMSVRYQQS